MLKMKQSRKWLHAAGHTNKHSSIGTSPTSLILRGKRDPGNVFFNYEEVFSNMRRNSNGKVPEHTIHHYSLLHSKDYRIAMCDAISDLSDLIVFFDLCVGEVCSKFAH